MATTKNPTLQHMTVETRKLIRFGLKSRNYGRPQRPGDGKYEEKSLARAKVYLKWLETVEMTPEIRDEIKFDKTFDFIIKNITVFYSDEIKNAARALYEKWISQNWGAKIGSEDEDISPDQESRSTSLDSVASTEGSIYQDQPSDTTPDAPTSPECNRPSLPPESETRDETPTDGVIVLQTELPPIDNPMFRERSIMYGIMILRTATGRRTYRLDPTVPKRTAKVFGHNGIPVGAWFANQLVALQRGAHGSRGGGIRGTADSGAYSIVVSGMYEDLDNDRGETLHYSGSGSHENGDRMKPAPSTIGMKALKTSLRTRKPVRVLRAGGSSRANRWLPRCGLRYDGLYQVTALRECKNRKGGLYEQFTLVREPGQEPLEKLVDVSPTMQQIHELQHIQKGD
ncbi:PUA-like domain-containing protein [Hypoxylon trugodes]|uniref:PUA-like domain-containing protein n=1 Tax=Hypoxylon trugodes TaxID=326681 RepID=UPI00218DFDF4|nr:PUA-like domain-containing protein [Hypoxylon trugodes]KAI1392511.1 PUA-like domain-containing protein [Hypoxylon trugodes]